MSKIDILSMPVAKGLSGAEYFPLVQDGTNVRTQISLLSGVQFNLNTISNAQGAILYRNVKDWVALAPGTPGFVLATAGPAANPSWVENGTGTVSSVGLALPASVFSVSGTPVTSSGTLDGSFVTQIANTVFAGPTSGGDATPAFRSIVNGDIAAAGAALTKTDDTNVTLALGGAPATALVNAASLTFGWTGQLAVARGGTASASFTPYAVLCGGTTSTGALQSVANVGTSGQILTSNGAGALPTFQTAATALGQALTRTDDTNVTLTLGGAPTTALLSATSITAGWTGQLSVARGGTGLASGTSGGILGFTGSTTLASSVALTQHAIALGGGAGATPTPLGSLGTTTTVLHGNAAGAHTFAQVNLTSTVTGILPVPNGGSGIASATAYAVLCGGTTATNPFQSIASVGTMGQVLTSNGPGALPTFQSGAGTGDVVGPASATDNAIALYNGASGKLIKDSSVIVDASNNVSGIASVNTGPLAGFRNHLINGAMMVAQRGTSFTSTTTPANNDDTYLLDRWILLSDGNDIVDVTQATEAPAGGL